MISMASLWLPILVSAVIVFIASTIIHMGPFWHRGDFPQMPREAEVLNALRPLAIPPGDYFIPRAAGMEEMRSREFKDKLAQGPVALCELSIWYRRSWSLTLKAALDGLIYGALSGGTFGWLWPH